MGRATTGRPRLAAARAAMEREGLDALLLFTGTNLLFLSGYPTLELTLARPFYLVVPRRGAPVLLVHEGRAVEARRYGWIDDVRAYRRLSVAPLAELEATFDDLGVRRGRIALELGFEQRLGIPVAELDRIRSELATATFVDAADLLWRLRMVKSATDVAALRAACGITADAYRAAFAVLRVGQTDRALVRRMAGAMADGGGSAPWVLVAAGRGHYALATGAPEDRPFEPGDMAWLDAGCSVAGFWSDYSRAAVLGRPSATQRDAHRLLSEITSAGVAMVRPGVPVAEIARAVHERLHRIGLPVTSWTSDLAGRIGHGVGYDVTEPPHISEADPTVLEAGMVISIEPGVATEDGLFHVEQNVAVTNDGHEVLSTAPWELTEVTRA